MKMKIRFQFPSNGKVYPKLGGPQPCDRLFRRVSIPFKRESVSKVKLLKNLDIKGE